MSNQWGVSKVLMKRQGVFGNYSLIGVLHGNDHGDRAWHIQQVNENPVRDYCVQGGRIFSLKIGLPLNGPIDMKLERGDLILDMSEDERRMVLDAITQWEAEEKSAKCPSA